MNVRDIIGRDRALFAQDVSHHGKLLSDAIRGSRVLLIGGAGSIGKEVAAQIFCRGPAALHIVDISENNLVELVRSLRSSVGYIEGETLFLPVDMGGIEFRSFVDSQQPYDHVLNLAALKHVRSEKDAYSLMRMIRTNVLHTRDTLAFARGGKARKYFAVSTDKAKNPANLMGATKRIMEDVLFREDGHTTVSTARFANVAFSDGSLLHGFRQRLALRQPISAPRDVRRYFMTGEESGLLCLCSLALGRSREIFFPKLDAEMSLLTFSAIAVRFLESEGYEPVEVSSEEEARAKAIELIPRRKWPCYFFGSDTSGEKPFEEFCSNDDAVDWSRFEDIGVITAPPLTASQEARLDGFLSIVTRAIDRGNWTKAELVRAICDACPDLSHVDTGKYLDDKM
ncbi:MAG: polysaccharide biosynthesis protein [Alphaproteobacteria bacterium]|nr:polysaccharide biosynthesis protein [Alphaproteobacteria bacterium]